MLRGIYQNISINKLELPLQNLFGMFNVSNILINMQIVHVLSKVYDLEVSFYDHIKSIYVV